MFTVLRLPVRLVLWVLAPTLLLSIFLQSFALCIDPLILPNVERKLPPRISFFIRWVWLVLLAVTILYSWNIDPSSYGFYLHEALPFAPLPVWVGLALALGFLIWIGAERKSQGDPGYMSKKIIMFRAGLVLIGLKIALGTNVVGIPVLSEHLRSPILLNLRLIFSDKSKNKKESEESPQSTFAFFIKKQKFLPPRVIMMLVESWGETRTGLAGIAGELGEKNYQVVGYGFTTYRGPTLSGEFRELCSKYMQPSEGMNAQVAALECAPKFFKDHGYDVVGLHGYKKLFYARDTFWRRFGIQTRLFDEELKSVPHCDGAFAGVCDESLIGFGIDFVDRHDAPSFLYMLTLSSHEPIKLASAKGTGKHFATVEVVHPTQVVTRRAISELLDRLQKTRYQPCTLVYVAGDHQPPSASARGGIFERAKVPYVIFTVNCSAAQANQLAAR